VCYKRKSGAPNSSCLPRIVARALQQCVTEIVHRLQRCSREDAVTFVISTFCNFCTMWCKIFRNQFLWHIYKCKIYISIVKPTRCINVSNLFYWSNTLHVSDGLSVHNQEFKTVHTATGICQTVLRCAIPVVCWKTNGELISVRKPNYNCTLDDGIY